MAEARGPEFPVAPDVSDSSGSRSRRDEKSYKLSAMGLSVDSCLSAGELCEEEAEGEQHLSGMSDSFYSTVSELTVVGACRCPDVEPCRCEAVRVSAEAASSSTDSGTSVRECARSKESTTTESSPQEQQALGEESGPLFADNSEKLGNSGVQRSRIETPSGHINGSEESNLPAVTVSVEPTLPAAGARGGQESTRSAPSDGVKPDPITAAAGGGSGLQVPEPDRARRLSLDSSGVLAAVFRQNEQFHQLNDTEDDRPRSFTISSEVRRSQSRSTSASESHSEPAGGGESSSSPGCDLEEALYQFHHQRRDSYTSSVPSDVSVQELELETTGDFPHDFQFPGAGGSSRRPSAVWPDEEEAREGRARRAEAGDRLGVRQKLDRTLSDQPRRVTETAGAVSGSLPVPVVVVEAAEEPAAAAAAAVPSAARSPPVRRGLLARLVDSTAAFLLGGMRDGGGDRRHRSYTVSASDCRQPAAAAAAAASSAAAAARLAAAVVGGDQPVASGGAPGSGLSPARTTLAPPGSPVLGTVEDPAPCRQCREPSCSPEVACQPPLARRRSVHSDSRPTTQTTEGNDELLVRHQPSDGSIGGQVGQSPTSESPADERRKMRQQSMQNELRVKVTYHTVKPAETIPSIAAFYECLPGELKELNRLQFKRTVLPGQVLRILDRRRAQESPKPEGGGGGGDAGQEEGGWPPRRPVHSGSSQPGLTPDEIRRKQYIQLTRTRLFTESEGVAVGTLIFTPNSLMFRPNVSDPLVVESGVEYYTVDIPVRYLVTAEYYTEPPHRGPTAESQRREAHRESFGTSAHDEPPPAASQLTSAVDGAGVVHASADGAQVAPSPTRAKRPCSPDSDDSEGPAGATAAIGDSQPSSPQPAKTDEPGLPAAARRSQFAEAERLAYSRRSSSGRASFSAPPPPQEGEEECDSPLSIVIPIVSSASSASEGSELSFPLSASLRSQESFGATSPGLGATASEETSPDTKKNNRVRGAKETGSRRSSSASLRSFKNETALHEKPSLFKAADELLRVHTPVVNQPPLYLELVTGKARGRLLPRAERSKVMFCGQRRLPSRVLFAVPRDSCEQLYKFVCRWVPELSDDMDLMDKLERQGFEQIDSDDDIWEPEELEEDWEKVELRATDGPPAVPGSLSVDTADGESQQQPPPPPSPLDAVFLPDLIGRTELLTDEARLCLQRHLPARVEGHQWQLVFNTAEHGFSLKTLYRQAVEYDCPMLLVVQDSAQHVFGAVCTDPIRFGKHFYGTGESFLFTLRPQFGAYRWSGENQYFARGSTDCLEFGSGDGRSGLFLDEGLVRGYTEPCQTYNNDPLTDSKDFSIIAVELWALG